MARLRQMARIRAAEAQQRTHLASGDSVDEAKARIAQWHEERLPELKESVLATDKAGSGSGA